MPLGSVAVVMVSAAVIVMVNDLVAVCPPPVTLTVKLNVPAAVGVPARLPADVSSVIPAGSAPVDIDQVNVPLPPVAASGWL